MYINLMYSNMTMQGLACAELQDADEDGDSHRVLRRRRRRIQGKLTITQLII